VVGLGWKMAAFQVEVFLGKILDLTFPSNVLCNTGVTATTSFRYLLISSAHRFGGVGANFSVKKRKENKQRPSGLSTGSVASCRRARSF